MRHTFYACLVAVAAWAIVRYQPTLEALAAELRVSTTWQGIPVLTAAAVIVSAWTLALFVVAIRRTSRWLTARRHLRMLKDPERAALVPPLPLHLQSLDPSAGHRLWQGMTSLVFVGGLLLVAALMYESLSSDVDRDKLLIGLAFLVILFFAGLYGLVDAVLRWRRMLRAARWGCDG